MAFGLAGTRPRHTDNLHSAGTRGICTSERIEEKNNGNPRAVRRITRKKFIGEVNPARVTQEVNKMPVGSSKNPVHGRPHQKENISSHKRLEVLCPWKTEDSAAGGGRGTCKWETKMGGLVGRFGSVGGSVGRYVGGLFAWLVLVVIIVVICRCRCRCPCRCHSLSRSVSLSLSMSLSLSLSFSLSVCRCRRRRRRCPLCLLVVIVFMVGVRVVVVVHFIVNVAVFVVVPVVVSLSVSLSLSLS